MKNDYFSRIKFRFLKKSAMTECFRKSVKIIFLEKVIYFSRILSRSRILRV